MDDYKGKVAILSANLGSFDNPVLPVHQDVAFTYHLFTDKNFLPRFNSMTPRLQARIPKMWGWQMFPGYEYYIWLDSSLTLGRKDSVKWLLEQLGDADIAVFKHPHRNKVQEEANYLKERIELERAGKKQKYILPRYENERIDDQMAVIDPNQDLYASPVFIYKNNLPARDLLAIWWLHTSLYHSIDQLSLPISITRSGAEFNVIPDNYLKCKYLTYTRKHGHG